MADAPRLSVIICAWTPSSGLEAAIDSLAGQSLDPEAFEVIVVDNSPRGGAAPAVAALAGRAPLRLRYAHEPRLGLSAARNCGIAQARGAIVAFTDDDAQAHPDWAANLLAAFRAWPQASCVGGPIVLRRSAGLPRWWDPSFNELCGELDYGPARRAVGYPRYPYGGNMAFPRTVLTAAGGFSTALGPVGHRPFDGEEFELCVRLERAGGTIVFDPDVIIYHHVSTHRLTRRFVLRKAFYHGRTMAMIEAGHFGRRFALRRSLQWRRNPVARRRGAWVGRGGLDGETPGHASLETWLARTQPRYGGGLTLKAVAQGLGYASQTALLELWRPSPLRASASSGSRP